MTDFDGLLNEEGIYICAICRHYDAHALENCALGFAAVSDCPEARKAALGVIKSTLSLISSLVEFGGAESSSVKEVKLWQERDGL